MADIEYPAWLPGLVDCRAFDAAALDYLFQVFTQDFGPPTQCYFRGCPVWFDSRKLGSDPYPEGFWHVITRDNKSAQQRQVDFRRAERLAWCAAVIQNAGDPTVTCWHFRHDDGRIRAALWLQDLDYIVLLERQSAHGRPIYKLITAYVVDEDYSRRKFKASLTRTLSQSELEALGIRSQE